MHHGSLHPGVAGSELTRLLARLSDVPPAEGRPAFAERLGQWLGWTGDIALSAALNATPPASTEAGADGVAEEEADLLRLRADLDAAITARPREPDAGPIDFDPHRRHCLAQQVSMQEAIAGLRLRLRHSLARRSAVLARLAAIDEVMEQTLAPHERRLMALVPLRLQAHFERMQRAAEPDDGRWPEAFRDDMNCVLRAELAHRLLPAQGLLDALRLHPPT